LESNIDWSAVISYWLEEADNDLKVADDLFEKENYSYSLFFGHLALEKILKGIFVKKNKLHAPLVHNLERLAESAGIVMSEKQKESLIKISSFNIEARYPDIKRTFRSRCTREFTEIQIIEIKEVFQWLKSVMK